MIKKLLHGLVLTIAVTLPGFAVAGLDRDIKVVIEEPTVGESYSGITNLRGWAVSQAGIGRYYFSVYIDGEFVFYMPIGGKREDVASVYPNYPDSDQSGFSMAFNYKSLSPGTHEIRVRAYDNDDNYNDAVASFTTERFESDFINDVSKVNLNAASNISVIDQHTILVEGASVENRKWDFALKWDQASQSFKTEEIRRSGSGSGGDSSSPINNDVYACVTSPDSSYYSSDSVVTMKNGLELINNSGKSWYSGDEHTVFRSRTGNWYTIQEAEEMYRIEVTREPSSCFEYAYGEVTEVSRNYEGDSVLVIGTEGEITVSSSCPMDIGSKLGGYSRPFGAAYVVDLLTADVCEAKAVEQY